MKRRPALPVILCAALLAACGRPAAIPEAEPNDAHGQAHVLRGEFTVDGTLNSSDDVDTYRLEVAEPHNARVRVSGVPNADIVLTFCDKDGKPLKVYDETGPDGQEQAVDLGLDPGTYLFRVSVKGTGRVASAKPYALILDYEPMDGREREPDESAAQSTPVTDGAAGGRYFPARHLLAADKAERDWLSLSVPQDRPMVLDAELSGVPGVDPILMVCDGDGRRVREASPASAGEGTALRGIGLSGTKAFAVLQAQGPAGNPRESYRLQTSWRRWMGDVELEPNESSAAATPFDGESMAGALAPVGDQDWYRFSAPAGGSLSVELSPVADLDLRLSLRDGKGRELAHADASRKSGGETIAGFSLAAGDYFLAVTEKSGKVDDATFTYALKKTLKP